MTAPEELMTKGGMIGFTARGEASHGAAAHEPVTRLKAVDALRGLALAGMLVVHLQYYADGPVDWGARVQTMVDLLFAERFWALFAFLFGVGFALQMERRGDTPGFAGTYLRRLLVLFYSTRGGTWEAWTVNAGGVVYPIFKLPAPSEAGINPAALNSSVICFKKIGSLKGGPSVHHAARGTARRFQEIASGAGTAPSITTARARNSRPQFIGVDCGQLRFVSKR